MELSKLTFEAGAGFERLFTDLDFLTESGLDIVPAVSRWLSEKLGGECEVREQAIQLIATYAVLETAEHVFNVGSGFVKMDVTGFTLNRIKNIAESIEEKMDIVLGTPIKLAFTFLNDAMDMFIRGSYEEAYLKLDQVITNATQAFHFAAQNEKKITSFKESIKAIKFLVFAKVLRNCYDKDRKQFLPYIMLDTSKKLLISDQLERLVKDCLVQSEKMRKRDFIHQYLLPNKKDRENDIQDTVDKVLSMTYPYISQGKGWTNINTEIAVDTTTSVEVTVKPFYVPDGEEDKTKISFGKRKGDGPITVDIWRTDSCIVVSSANGLEKIEFSSLEDEVNMTIPVWPPSVMISSAGPTAESIRYCGIFGEYEYQGFREGIGHYRQRHTVQSEGLFYIYRGSEDRWLVGQTLDGEAGLLYNESPSEAIPRDGWQFQDENEKLDQFLTVRAGKLDVGTVTITGADKSPRCNGDYEATGEYSMRRLVFKHNTEDLYLCCPPDYSHWWVSDHATGSGRRYLLSAAASLCPGGQRAAINTEYNMSSWITVRLWSQYVILDNIKTDIKIVFNKTCKAIPNLASAPIT